MGNYLTDGTFHDALEVDNGDGLRFLLLPGFSIDLGKLSWQGKNLSFLSKAEFSDSAHYNPTGMEGLSTFAGGFLATCGLRSSGLPNDCDGEHFGFQAGSGRLPQSRFPSRVICTHQSL